MKKIGQVYSVIGTFLGKIPFIGKIINILYEKIKYIGFISERKYYKKIYNFKAHEEYFKDSEKLMILTEGNESGAISGEIIKFLKQVSPTLNNVLLPGENENIKKLYSEIILKSGGKNFKVITAGLSENIDKKWDFENDIPENLGKFDLIISQAMIEHLIDPYKHIKDLSILLEKSGYLIVNTMAPGFAYHRIPSGLFKILSGLVGRSSQ